MANPIPYLMNPLIVPENICIESLSEHLRDAERVHKGQLILLSNNDQHNN